ncbi:MAG: peptide-binding protein [Desulfarculaceae bacterium]|nr:peptide-binding protein [Desulfarculaceae bacterium]MCF8072078.1 peptide-binding protein [Desulfarculaceae bacterium]MCF8101595.1 peptide-binding protein [Desulfarculaceae bacterium]MCF8115145.1 peptide-binding protein [Desulfarculaceae bacterium]
MVLRWLALLLCLALCGAGSPALAADNGGSLVIGTIGDATSMIPMITSDSASHEMSGLVYNGLLKYDKDLNLVGDLAESWQVSDDGLTITFKLRKGVRWQDGKPYTAKDALFNWRFMVDPKTPTAYSGDYLKVKDAAAPDDYTFVVHYKEPFAPGLASWTLSQMPRHLLEGKDVRASELNRHPMGTGPYKFQRWDPGARVMLAYNPDYFEGRPHISQVTYRVIPDMATMFLELKAGGLDWMGLNALQYRRQTNTAFFKKNFVKYKYLASAYTYLGYNLKDPRFSDKRVRQALSYAINKKELIKGVLLGLGQVCTGPVKPGTYWYNPKVKHYPYDPAKAKALLKQAGWEDRDGDGLLDKDGRPFEFTILTNQGNSYRANTGVIIQQRLAGIGVRVKLRTVEWAAFIKEFVNKGRFEAVLLGWTVTPDPDQFDIWHSSRAKPGQLNFTYYKNPELDKILTEQRRTFDREKRRALIFRMQEILAEDQPYTFLYVPQALPVVAARIRGIAPAPAGISYNFIRWWVPKSLQKPAMTR